MASTRASGLWSQYSGYTSASAAMSDDDLEDGFVDDGRTPLDRTIDRIGMGSYQWTLLALCGLGWLADNMWLEAVAIILPRVQTHYSVPDNYIGTMSFTMFAGMMVGALGWGTCSDLMGRSTAFNLTLSFTALFGILAGFANSFGTLCVVLFFLGSAVGGSMPTDGTLLLEHMPRGKQYLVTVLSVFFSFGSVLAAIAALIIIPGHSCPTTGTCDVDTQNMGWKYLLIVLGIFTLTMFLARMVFFRLHESPRFLVHAGRPQDALVSLQMISKYNGDELALDISDVRDHHVPSQSPSHSPSRAPSPSPASRVSRARPDARLIFDAGATVDGVEPAIGNNHNVDGLQALDYSATGESPVPLDAHSFDTPHIEALSRLSSHLKDELAEPGFEDAGEESGRLLQPSVARDPSTTTNPALLSTRRQSTASFSSLSPKALGRSRVLAALPPFVRRPLLAWLDRLAMVLGPEWRRTTLLVWAAWCAMALAYTMFNVFLPKLLETRDGAGVVTTASSLRFSDGPEEGGDGPIPGAPGVDTGNGLEESLWNVVIFTLGGCPGAIVGAYLIETPLGRRWSLAGSTFITALFCVGFIYAEDVWAVRASTVGISLSSTTMWAVLYGWTPEIFATKVRGTACGTASALSRIGGMTAPMLGGFLLASGRAAPVYGSVIVFVLAGVSVLMLNEDEGAGADRTDDTDGPTIVH